MGSYGVGMVEFGDEKKRFGAGLGGGAAHHVLRGVCVGGVRRTSRQTAQF